jgi:hypothetical protein
MLEDHQDRAFGMGSADSVPVPRTSFSWDEGILQVSANDAPQDQRAEGSTEDVHRDLCCVCTYKAECMYRGTPEQPKLCCELFDVDVQALSPHEDEAASAHFGGDSASDVKGGLCCNCEHRKHCTIREPEGNVWHCEEYC